MQRSYIRKKLCEIHWLTHQIDSTYLDIIIEANQICIGTNSDLSLNTSIAAMAGRGFGCHADSCPKGNICFFVHCANQTIAGSHTAKEAVSGRRLTNTVLDDYSEFTGAERNLIFSLRETSPKTSAYI